ncbi:hypothetical protein TSUD_344390 [Trifolium subterraneum]|nr:hypothetical protein TSUD_344390 [Trifolium subterraneum]
MKDLTALRDDLMELKPTLFAGVPRVFEKVSRKQWKSIQELLYNIISAVMLMSSSSDDIKEQVMSSSVSWHNCIEKPLCMLCMYVCIYVCAA